MYKTSVSKYFLGKVLAQIKNVSVWKWYSHCHLLTIFFFYYYQIHGAKKIALLDLLLSILIVNTSFSRSSIIFRLSSRSTFFTTEPSNYINKKKICVFSRIYVEYLALNVRKVPISQSIKIVPDNNASKNTGDVYLDTACKDSIVQINLDLIKFIINLY